MSEYCVAFDIGNVLCEVDLEHFYSIYNENIYYGNRSLNNAQDFLDCLHAQQDLGASTVDKKLIELSLFGAPDLSREKIEKIKRGWNETIVIHDMMIEFKNDLLRRGVNVALLSNMGFEHKEHIKKKHPELFDGCILHLSCDVGARKPSRLYYQSFLLDHPEFKGALYLDDLDNNLGMGEEYSFRPYKLELKKVLEYTEVQKEELWRHIRWCIFKK